MRSLIKNLIINMITKLAPINRISVVAFLAVKIASGCEDRQTNAGVDLSAYAGRFGRSLGNDLGNVVLTWMAIRGMTFDSERVRNQCYEAATRLVGESKIFVPWSPPDSKSAELHAIGEPTKRRLTLELPGGLRLDEDVEIAFKVDPKNSTPDSVLIWIEFTITNPDKKNARITISGACHVNNKAIK